MDLLRPVGYLLIFAQTGLSSSGLHCLWECALRKHQDGHYWHLLSSVMCFPGTSLVFPTHLQGGTEACCVSEEDGFSLGQTHNWPEPTQLGSVELDSGPVFTSLCVQERPHCLSHHRSVFTSQGRCPCNMKTLCKRKCSANMSPLNSSLCSSCPSSEPLGERRGQFVHWLSNRGVNRLSKGWGRGDYSPTIFLHFDK